MIEIDHLTKRFRGGQMAIDQLCLQVREGEVFGFLGPNGAGKTTTIRILTTLSLPTEGRAMVAGLDVAREPQEVRKNIGYVAQESGVEYCLTGRENLVLQGHLYHLSRRILQQRVAEVLKVMDLEDAAGLMVSRYSGGMRRRLDIAMALLHQPRLLFLDEPTLGLDPQSRLNLWDYIRRINQSDGITIFLTTHYLEEADKLAHRVGILDRGKLMVVDTPEKLKDDLGGDVVVLALENGLETEEGKEVQRKLRALPFVKDLLLADQECSVYVNQGREALPKIFQVMDAAGLTVKAATLSRPSLDDIYLKYAGRRLKEEDETSAAGDWQKWWKPGAAESDASSEGSSGEASSKASSEASGQWPSGSEGSDGDWQKWQSGKGTDGKGDEVKQNWRDHASSG